MKLHSDKAIEEFVRGPLGCNCPAKVFDHIIVIDKPSDFKDISADLLIEIGGILLVLVLRLENWKVIQSNLESIFKRGIEVRNAKGFNRFRLVVAATDTDKARQSLNKQFDSFSDIDEKIHLHILTPEQLPSYTASL